MINLKFTPCDRSATSRVAFTRNKNPSLFAVIDTVQIQFGACQKMEKLRLLKSC